MPETTQPENLEGQSGSDRDFAAEYRAAVAEESDARDFAFLDLPRDVCGIPLQQMTLRHLLVRLMIGCPFFVGDRKPGAEDVASFLWHLSVNFQTPSISKRGDVGRAWVSVGAELSAWVQRHAAVRARRRFIRKIVFPNGLSAIGQSGSDRLAELIEGIREYIEWTFYDAPPTSEGGSTVAYTSFVAGYLDFLGSQYDWSAISSKPVLDTPVVLIYQLVNKIRKRLDPKNTVFFNRKSDKVRADYYAERNATAAGAETPGSTSQPINPSTAKPSVNG